MFTLMSGTWYYQRLSCLDDSTLEDMAAHIENGTIVAFADDTECFAYLMGVDENDLVLVE